MNNPDDRSNFVVMMTRKTGLEPAPLDPNTTTEESIIEDIANGQIEGRVAYIDEYNIVEGYSCRITEDIAQKVANLVLKQKREWKRDRYHNDLITFLDDHGQASSADYFTRLEQMAEAAE